MQLYDCSCESETKKYWKHFGVWSRRFLKSKILLFIEAEASPWQKKIPQKLFNFYYLELFFLFQFAEEEPKFLLSLYSHIFV